MPSRIVYDELDLSRALFHNCDVSQVLFTSTVTWGLRNGRKVVFDEAISPATQWLVRGGVRDFRAIAQIYQQLKKNYDARLDYWTADEFHFGEMEMKRLAVPTSGPLLKLRQWWHERLSLVALYRWGSDYGNSYGKPIWWIGAVLLAFALLFPCVGLQRSVAGTPVWTETYQSVWHAAGSHAKGLKWEAGIFGKSVLTAVDAATFQKSAEYVPAYPWGRVLAIAEALLTSTLFALFLLAIRRQFRR